MSAIGSTQKNCERFPSTLSCLVRTAVGPVHSPDTAAALGQLCELYHRPLLAFAHGLGCDENEALDLTHEFLRRLLAKGRLPDYQKQPGVKFRSFLLTCFKRHVWQAWRQRPGAPAVPLDVFDAEASAHSVPELRDEHTARDTYERRCGIELLNHVTARLRAEYEMHGATPTFERLSPYFWGDSSQPYSEVAAELGIREATARKRVFDMKKRWAQLLREELAVECRDDGDLGEEIRYLLRLFGGNR